MRKLRSHQVSRRDSLVKVVGLVVLDRDVAKGQHRGGI